MNLKREREILDMPVNKLNNEMIVRIMVGFMIGPIFLGAIIFSEAFLKILILLATITMFFEWYNMTKGNMHYNIAGLFIISIPISSLFSVIYMFDNYKYIFFTYGIIIASMDVFAMFGGKYFKGPKLVPNISPNKTWSGLITGLLACIIISQLIVMLPEYDFAYTGWKLALFASVLGLLGQASDIFISYFKRKFNLKDTGNILPGHGGVLDRFDSIIFTAPFLLFVCL